MNIRFVPLVLAILGLVALSRVSGGLAVSVLVGSQPLSVVQPYQYLTSVNAQYSLVMRPDCNLVIYNFSQPLLATLITAPAPPNCSLWMQDDGNLVIYNFTSTTNQTRDLVAGNALWAMNYHDTINGIRSFLLLGGDGRFDFYDTNSTLRQTSGNTNLYNASELYLVNDTESGYPNWTNSEPNYTAWKPNASLDGFPYMPAEYFLSAGQRLMATSATYALELGSNCNLQSKQDINSDQSYSEILWKSGSWEDGPTCELRLQLNGILQIVDVNSGKVYWHRPSNGNSDGNWILKVNRDTGRLSISDIQNSSRVLWTNKSGPPSSVSTALIVGVVVGGAFVLTLAAWWLYSFARERILDPSERAFQARLREKGGTSYAFSPAKIKQATKNYENAIGRGGFGKVYKGKLSDGQEVAAKVMTSRNSQSKEMFYNEIELLSMVHHKYLVSLVGYSCTRTHQVLIYEYMGGGDLRHRLQGESGAGDPLSWRQRTIIIHQVAEGLEYLHDKCSPPIIHRDVKSENILLTDKLVAKVADFGLSKLKAIGKEDDTHISTVVKGTPGYLDPEYHETGMLTEKSDVYAFGVVLMEIFTGRPPVYRDTNIIQTVRDAWKQKQFDGLADPSLGEEFDRDELVGLVELALWCVRRSNGDRPYMRDVVRRLHELLSTKLSQPDLGIDEDDRRREVHTKLMTMGSEDLESEIRPLSQSSSSNMHSEGLIRQRSYQSRSHQAREAVVTVFPDFVQL